jgi:hypothetical protein
MHIDFEGGDRLKFGDVIVATASAAVIQWLVYGVLTLVLIPVNSYWGLEAAALVSLLLATVAVGYVFAGKIREESRMRSIGKIVVLFAVWTIFVSMIMFSGIGHYSTYIDEGLRNMFSTGPWTTTDWVSYEAMSVAANTALDEFFVLVLGFIGLYIGSMLRKPRKS